MPGRTLDAKYAKLKGAVPGQFITRFSPESSGYMDIGHAKACMLNEHYARELQGKFVLRFDDTNPTTHKVEYEESIKEDMATLEIKVDVVTHTSDHFDEMIGLAEDLIRSGKAYVDDTPSEQLRYERQNNIESACRDTPVEINMARWQEMKQGSEEGQRCCLRAKIEGAKARNKTLADPVIFRVHLTPHETTGERFKVYPTYDFACPIADVLDGVTHALRTTEFHDRDPQYHWLQRACGLREVTICDFGRVDFKYTLMGKPVMLYYLEKGLCDGWDDPRMPTVRGLLRHGMTVEALRVFMNQQGSSRNLVNLDWSTVWAVNRKILDRDCPRLLGLDAGRGVAVATIRNGEAWRNREEVMPQYRKNPDLGTKIVHFHDRLLMERADTEQLEPGAEFTLIGWVNAVVVGKDGKGDIVIELKEEGDRRHTKKVNWLADTGHYERVRALRYDHILTKEKFSPEDNFTQYINPDSRHERELLVEAHIRKLPKGSHAQIMKQGYFVVDVPAGSGEGGGVVLIQTPDGHASDTEAARQTSQEE